MKSGFKKNLGMLVKSILIVAIMVSVVVPFGGCKGKTDTVSDSGNNGTADNALSVIADAFTVDENGVLGVTDKYKLTDAQRLMTYWQVDHSMTPVDKFDKKMALRYIFMNFAEDDTLYQYDAEITEDMIKDDLSKWYKEVKKVEPTEMSLNDLFKAKLEYINEQISNHNPAYDGYKENDICTFDEYLAKICPDVPSLPETVEIPAEINGVAVKEIPEGLFNLYNFCSTKELVLPDTITKIDHAAFSFMTTLKSVNLPDSITEIDKSAFLCCLSLESITLPKTLTVLKDSLFSNCISMTAVNGLDHIETIESQVFSNCTKLVLNELPQSVKKIGFSAFENCISLPENVLNAISKIEDKTYMGNTNGNDIAENNTVAKKPEEKQKSYDTLYVKDDLSLLGNFYGIEVNTLIMPEKMGDFVCNSLDNVSAKKIIFPDDFTVDCISSPSDKFDANYIYLCSLDTLRVLQSVTMPCGYKYKLSKGLNHASPPTRLTSVVITPGKTGIFEELDANMMSQNSVIDVKEGVTALKNCYNFPCFSYEYAQPAAVVNLPDSCTNLSDSFNSVNRAVTINAPSGITITNCFNNSPNITVNYR